VGAELARETTELKDALEVDLDELTRMSVGRGLNEGLARQVTVQLTREDTLAALARDVLGISAKVAARPIQATVV
jgi:VIT1/CCC1 family predicted Fe2+/Mn2+ transporter